MTRPTRYPRELRERALRLLLERRDEYDSECTAMRSIAGKLGIGSTETLRIWVRPAEVDGGLQSQALVSCVGFVRGASRWWGCLERGCRQP